MERIVTKEDYLQSLKNLHHAVYYNGKRVEDITEHPALRPHIDSAALTYELALRPEHEDLMTATSHLTGRKIRNIRPTTSNDSRNISSTSRIVTSCW